jgi:tRNA threonylcarbamoyladenosine biosynthesis protein TsaB
MPEPAGRKILAVETASEVCGVALWINGEIHERREERPNRHAESLAPMVEELLAAAQLRPAQLDGLALSRGPGGFTGLRVGAALVQGIAWGADLPVATVSSLRVLAHGTPAPRVLAAFDARMGQLYWGRFEDCGGETRGVSAERVSVPGELELPPGEWLALGSGIDRYLAELPPAIREAHRAGCQPRAPDLAALAAMLAESEWGPADRAVPVYVRDAVAQVPGGGRD